MKILAAGVRQEEIAFFEKWAAFYHDEVEYLTEFITTENVGLAKGFDAVCIVVSCKITAELAESLQREGVKYILTRAAGTDHLAIQAIHAAGLYAANVPRYSPSAVSEFTVLLTLAVLRHLKEQINRSQVHNFSIAGLQGKELRNMTVGIVGTGRIGCTTIQNLSGFGCRILAFDSIQKEEVKRYGEYVSFHCLLKESDILIFHCPLTDDNYHMISEETIGQCKEGIILINCARGGLFDCEAVLDGLKSGRIGALAMDVYEKEHLYLRQDKSEQTLSDPVIEELIRQKNVIYTAHTAFYTEEAVSNMIETSFSNLREYKEKGSCSNEVIA